jgi:hypothetical protein
LALATLFVDPAYFQGNTETIASAGITTNDASHLFGGYNV